MRRADKTLEALEKSLEVSKQKLWELLIAIIMGGVMGITLGNLATVIFCVAAVSLVIIVHDFVVVLTAPNPSKIVIPPQYERPVSPYRKIRGISLILSLILLMGISGYYSRREIRMRDSEAGPKYCLVDYSGNITEDHGVSNLLEHGISMSYDNYGEPSEMYVMFTKYMIHAPVVTSVESRIFQVTPSKEDLANGFHFTFEAMQTVPRTPYPKDAPFCIKMEIIN